MFKWILAAAALVAIPAVASAQDADAGKGVFGKCALATPSAKAPRTWSVRI